MSDGVDLAVTVGVVRLPTPIIAASGTFGYGTEFAGLVDLAAVGAISVKGLSLAPYAGKKAPRLVESPAGMLNAIGRRLVEAVLDGGRTTGARVVYLEVRAGNVAARRLYRRLGFRDLGVRRAYYGPGQDAIVMELRLAGER